MMLMTTSLSPDSAPLAALLQQSAALHRHLCPRQVLGVRMGLYAAELLGLALPQSDKRLFTIVETDGCFADGVSVATGCTLGLAPCAWQTTAR
jgi:formylmethanofuran dehydrogenase subunit E